MVYVERVVSEFGLASEFVFEFGFVCESVFELGARPMPSAAKGRMSVRGLPSGSARTPASKSKINSKPTTGGSKARR
jgi:hypothetical protein